MADFMEALEAATFGSRQSKIDRNVLVDELKDMLRRQADYVRGAGDGDRAKLQSSGYPLAKRPEPAGIPNAPLIKLAKMTGIGGQVELRWGSQHGATVYQVWMTGTDPTDGGSWVPVAATSRVTQTVDNLESYKAYWFAVSAIGAAGQSAKSDPAIARAA